MNGEYLEGFATVLSSTMVHHDDFRRYVQHDCFKFIQGGRLDMQALNIALGVEYFCLSVPHGFHSKGLLHSDILLWSHDLWSYSLSPGGRGLG